MSCGLSSVAVNFSACQRDKWNHPCPSKLTRAGVLAGAGFWLTCLRMDLARRLCVARRFRS